MSSASIVRGVTLSVLIVVTMSAATVGPVHTGQSLDGAGDGSKAYRTRTGKTIVVSETHPVGRSLSTIEVRSEGFEHNFGEVFEDRDPVTDVFTADLDGNGFDEIYIVTTSAGSGCYGNILGFASNQDKSLSMIHFPEVREGDYPVSQIDLLPENQCHESACSIGDAEIFGNVWKVFRPKEVAQVL